MLHIDDLEAALRQQLPTEYHSAIPSLAQILIEASMGALSSNEAQARLAASADITDALRTLGSRRIEVGGSVISFNGAQMGDVAFSGDVIGEKHEHYYLRTAPARNLQGQRNRQAMLIKLKTMWIDGFLKKSLTDELRIELNLINRPDVLEIPLNTFYKERECEPEPLPRGTSITQAFDQIGGELLVLGAPGTGKTMLLLELLRELLGRAKRDDTHSTPVLFPLSTWATERKPLKEWMVDQLNIIYDVPRKLGQEWVSENEILPLLDGLDEVAREHRDACIDTINAYRQELGGLTPIVVTSRMAEYQSLRGKLRLKGAVLVESLTKDQVASYLMRVGEPLQAVRHLVENDAEVSKLLNSPLMLNVVTLAFRHDSTVSLQAKGTVEEQKSRLWEAYVERMFTRKSREERYSHRQTILWLSSLARQLINENGTVFMIEYMQPNWLSPSEHRLYKLLCRIQTSLFGGFYCGLLFLVMGGPIAGVFGLAFGMLLLSIGWGEEYVMPVEKVVFHPDILPAVARKTLIFTIVSAVLSLPFLRLPEAVALSVLINVFGAFSDILRSGLQGETVSTYTKPNQGILLSLIHAIAISLAISSALMLLGLVFSLIFSLNLTKETLPSLTETRTAYVLFSGPIGVAITFFLLCLFTSYSIFGRRLGGAAALHHYMLRWTLAYYRRLPFLDLIPWLDHCCDHLFLRRVGGGYIFIHRLLMEHFAAMTDEDIAGLSAEVEGARKKP